MYDKTAALNYVLHHHHYYYYSNIPETYCMELRHKKKKQEQDIGTSRAPFPSPLPSPTGKNLLHSKGPHKTANQGSNGKQQLIPG